MLLQDFCQKPGAGHLSFISPVRSSANLLRTILLFSDAPATVKMAILTLLICLGHRRSQISPCGGAGFPVSTCLIPNGLMLFPPSECQTCFKSSRTVATQCMAAILSYLILRAAYVGFVRSREQLSTACLWTGNRRPLLNVQDDTRTANMDKFILFPSVPKWAAADRVAHMRRQRSFQRLWHNNEAETVTGRPHVCCLFAERNWIWSLLCSISQAFRGGWNHAAHSGWERRMLSRGKHSSKSAEMEPRLEMTRGYDRQRPWAETDPCVFIKDQENPHPHLSFSPLRIKKEKQFWTSEYSCGQIRLKDK